MTYDPAKAAQVVAEIAAFGAQLDAEIAAMQKSSDFHVPEPELATEYCVCGCHADSHDEYDATWCGSADGCARFTPAVPVVQARRFAATELRRMAFRLCTNDARDLLARADQLDGGAS